MSSNLALVFLAGEQPVTSTLAIAEHTQNEHASVIKLVRTYLSDLESFGQVDLKSTRPEAGGRPVEFALLNEQQATLLITYMRNTDVVRAFKIRLVSEFYAMAQRIHGSAPTVPMLPAQVGQITIQCMMEVARLYGTPPSYALQVAASEAARQTGMPWDRLLTQAEAMNNVPSEAVMLEPTELGRLFDLSAVAMNRKLAELGLQVKEGGEWRPTEEGKDLCVRHAWVSGAKSGYNLKWKAVEIERRLGGAE